MKNRLAAFFHAKKGGVVYGGIAELEKLVQNSGKIITLFILASSGFCIFLG